ncbi:MAG: glutathione peroxidase [Oscillospiraceae bacterium]|nr:glutathione peroxidase [Oscillospiraceae bacterium]
MSKARPGFMTNRNTYKEVKKYNHAQFDQFCIKIYQQGYEDGRASVPGTDLTEIMDAIKNVKGIGDKRMDQIQEAVAALFQQENQKGETDHE